MTLQIATLLIALTALVGVVIALLILGRLSFLIADLAGAGAELTKRFESAVAVGGERNETHLENFRGVDGRVESMRLDLAKVALTADEVKAKLILRKEASDKIAELGKAVQELAKGPPQDAGLKACVTELERRVDRIQEALRGAGEVDPEAETETNIQSPASIFPDATGDSIAQEPFGYLASDRGIFELGEDGQPIPTRRVRSSWFQPNDPANTIQRLPEPAFSPADDNAHASNDGLEMALPTETSPVRTSGAPPITRTDWGIRNRFAPKETFREYVRRRFHELPPGAEHYYVCPAAERVARELGLIEPRGRPQAIGPEPPAPMQRFATEGVDL